MIFGLLGYGRFGKLWAEALLPFGNIMVHDIAVTQLSHPNIKIVPLQDVAQADLIFILTPISKFEAACLALKPSLRPDALVIDCCSVKMYPVNIMQKVFSKQQMIMPTHPLFGPDSVEKTGSIVGHKIVVCRVPADEIKYQQAINLFEKMGLHVILTTPEEHDKQMAKSQGLVHFIGRGLAALDMEQQELATPDFQALLNINKMVVNDTWQLFLDMQRYNPFTKEIRNKFIHQLNTINKEVDNGQD